MIKYLLDNEIDIENPGIFTNKQENIAEKVERGHIISDMVHHYLNLTFSLSIPLLNIDGVSTTLTADNQHQLGNKHTEGDGVVEDENNYDDAEDKELLSTDCEVKIVK